MGGAATYRQVLSSPKHTKFVAKHAARLLFVIIILGFDANIIQFRADNVLVYSIVIATLTTLTCTYFIVRLCVFTTTGNVKVSLGIHLFMSLSWLIDVGLILMMVSQWGESDSVTHFNMLVARVVMGAVQFLLWFIPMVNLVLAVVDRKECVFNDEHILMPQIHTTATRPSPMRSTQKIESWDSWIGEPHRTGPRPVLPES